MSSDEIAEFIRRAALRRQQQQQGRGAAPQPPVRPQQPPPQAPRTLRQAPPSAPEIIDAHPSDLGELSHRDAHLAEEIEQADEKLEAHLHSAFDHQLGSLDSSSKGLPEPEEFSYDAERKQVKGIAHELVAMMRSLKDFRKAVLLSEILNRPEDRW